MSIMQLLFYYANRMEQNVAKESQPRKRTVKTTKDDDFVYETKKSKRNVGVRSNGHTKKKILIAIIIDKISE